MTFNDKYTTQEKITADKEDKESKKTILSNGEYAIGELIESLANKIESLRGLLI